MSLSVVVSNLRLLGCFLLVHFGGALLLVVLVVVTGGKQSQLLVLGLETGVLQFALIFLQYFRLHALLSLL